MNAGNFIIGCILGACALVVMVVLMLEPEGRAMFVQGYLDWLATAAVLIVCITLGLASLIKWS
jgi:hypothetical protein